MILVCLQIYRELLSLVTFLRVHSNSKGVSYLSWQNTYPKLKTTCYIKLKFFYWTKLLENLLLAKYLISVCCFTDILLLTFILLAVFVWSDFVQSWIRIKKKTYNHSCLGEIKFVYKEKVDSVRRVSQFEEESSYDLVTMYL